MLTVVAIVAIADLLTGFGHWVEDAYCRRGMPGWIGSQVCDPNLKHHEDQALFAAGSLWARNYTTWLLAGSGAIFAVCVGSYFWAAVFCVTAIGNEIHSWSHRRPRHWLPRLLQDMAIVQTPQQHARHHRAPYTACYCTITNLCNPLLDRLRVWRGLEWSIEWLTGLAPNHRRGVVE